MNNRRKRFAVAVALVTVLLNAPSLTARQENDRDLLQAREAVWRAWFAGDIQSLEQLVPPETIVISGGEKEWKNQADVLRTATAFHAGGGKLIRLEFRGTKVQHFDNVAMVWSHYLVETEINSTRSLSSGRASEVFVRRGGRWINPGWHTDSEN